MKRIPFPALVFAVFLFRLFFGLCQSHWSDKFEQPQHYLVGLKFYTTGLWPYFGVDMADSMTTYQSQLPGALFGLFIGLPFFILPIPEAPFVLVNLLSIAGAVLLAWYIHQRLPSLPLPWLFLWIAVAPWSLHFSTHVYNMDYFFLPSTLFFIGFMEATPAFSLRLLHPRTANFLMGLSTAWFMQFHYSFVLMLPFLGLSLLLQWRQGRRLDPPLFFLLGTLLPLCFLAPTYLQYGFQTKTSPASGFMVPFNWDNVAHFFTVLARYLSIACSEIPRWIGAHTKDRLEFLSLHWPLFIPGTVLWITGLLQPFALLYLWSRKKAPGPHWPALKWLTLGAFLMAWASFWFTLKRPHSHHFLVLFPLVMTYSCYCWAQFKDQRLWSTAAKAFIVLSFLFQAGYAVAVAPKESIWTERAKVQRALDEKDYRIVAERVKGSFY